MRAMRSARPTAPGGRSRRRTPTTHLVRTGLALLALGVATPLAAGPAHAAVTLTEPHAVEVFPELDIVGVSGYDEPIVVEVWRDGVKIGSSGAPRLPGFVIPDEDEVADPMTRMLEVNHDSSVCWDGHTPDIVGGDQVRVITADDQVGESMDVAQVTVDDPQVEALDGDGLLNDIVMTGRAVDPDGTPMDLAQAEAEIVQPAFRDVGVPGWDRRVLLASTTGPEVTNPNRTFGPDDTGTLRADPARGDSYWVATWKNLPVPTADRPSFAELALDGEHSFVVTEGPGTEDTGGTGTTLSGPGDASGPAPGCPPAITYGVTGTTPTNVNIATAAAGGDFRIWGKAYSSSAVQVTVDDTDNDPSDAITVDGVVSNPATTADTTEPVPPVRQTWSAVVPMAQILDEDLDEGELIVSGEYAQVVESAASTDSTTTVFTHTEQTISGSSHTLLKDLQAPVAPTPSFPAGQYVGTQWLGVTAQDEIQETVRYRVGGPGVANPTGASPEVPGQIALSTTQTVKARAFDRAGNPGPVWSGTYTIEADPVAQPPGRPGRPDATAGNGSAHVTWTAPADNGGAPITGYRVRVYNRAGDTTFEVTVGNRLSTTVTGLHNGRAYYFTVAAINRAGEGPESLPSVDVTPIGPAGPGPGGDTERPTVTWCRPRPGETDWHRRENLKCKVSEQVRRVRSGTVRLKDTTTGHRVAIDVRYVARSRTIVINPHRDLAKNRRYVGVLTRGIRDMAGNPLMPKRWRFTTNT
jgi:hypothetical protein